MEKEEEERKKRKKRKKRKRERKKRKKEKEREDTCSTIRKKEKGSIVRNSMKEPFKFLF